MSTDAILARQELSEPTALAPLLVACIRALADTRRDLEQNLEALVTAETSARWSREYAQAVCDLNHWLLEELCRDRLRHYRQPLNPNSPEGRAALTRERIDVVVRWGGELDRRAKLREVAA